MSELSLKVSRILKAPVTAVYNAWLNPEMLARFMIPSEGMSVTEVEVDASEGGKFHILMKSPEKPYPHSGEYKKLNPYSQIVFSWESPFSIDGSEVTLNFSEVANGTKIEIIHVKFPSEESRTSHEGGWESILRVLDGVLTSAS